MKNRHTANNVCRAKSKQKVFQKFKPNGKVEAENMKIGGQQVVGSEAYRNCFQ